MAATSDDVVPSYINVYDRRTSKQVLDNVHGGIYLDSLCLKSVDTEQFQRLCDLKQLGLTRMVYPGAMHSRFKHSLKVYWLASDAVRTIADHQARERIERSDIQAVKLAGLLHDVGHGPFSHLFEHGFLPKVGVTDWSHEKMSVDLVDYIVDEHNIDIDDNMLKNVKAIEHADDVTIAHEVLGISPLIAWLLLKRPPRQYLYYERLFTSKQAVLSKADAKVKS